MSVEDACCDCALHTKQFASATKDTSQMFALSAVIVLCGLVILVVISLSPRVEVGVQNFQLARVIPFLGQSHTRNPLGPATETEDAARYPILASEALMAPKAHGTTEKMVQENLRWGCDRNLADSICSFNRHFAEPAGYWKFTNFKREIARDGEVTFYDSVSGKPLFVAPRGRTMNDFLGESTIHGWPSFRDEEVVWHNMRVIPSGRDGRRGEAVSVDGTHLGHNIPDRSGNRYCINLVSVAGRPQR